MGALFGTSGVRGVVNDGLDPRTVLAVGRALAATLPAGSRVAVGTDHRTSAEVFKRALAAGVLAGGCDVVDLGLVPTPTIALAGARLGCAASASVTASHNPPEYNGVKLWNKDGSGFSREQEEEVERLALGGGAKGALWSQVGRLTSSAEASRMHIDAVRAAVGPVDGLSVVYDGGCGAGCTVTPYLLRELGCRVRTLNAQPDGRFDAREHAGEPVAGAGDWERIVDLGNLARAVRETGSDLGLANDGDADRLLAVDERGEVVPADQLIALFADDALGAGGGGTVVTTVDASMLVEEVASKRGGEVVRTPVGDVFVSRAVRERGALLGAEPSGTFVLPKLHLCPDGPLAAAWLLRLLKGSGGPLSAAAARYPRYPMGRVRLDCPNERKAAAMAAVAARLGEALPGVRSVDTSDGVRVALSDGWLLVRASGTEPILRIAAEGRSEGALAADLKRAEEAVAAIVADAGG